ncbi:AcrR family transcriptional regulator [Amycolatopsis bartoniae]|uniref:TetR family transcriptional regulator n=1 Tax=Amycolatopsis bartoniae TaxID=941986 RepID=A0A8H9IRC6_9PSEU|nr:TetR/AcrR family transcriptional regulator [Amycolatopsis bartoniae]MBB2937935.1 AcrR family transcriptional regulator [Amycolatopsis bartoniae]TVT08573.1 TetR/AcrR family transcriptional regulator [Amycolatopsis bartoniae]GHF41817.1 TetR family transcriptional regulator [Amycolatopsis bartoniae]
MLTKKGAATRQRIIEAASAEIRERGVVATTLDDICRRSGTGKSQLFHYFPEGREQLLLAVAEWEAGQVLADQQPYLGELTSWPAWHQWRDAVVERYRRQGVHCPLGVLITEIGRHSPAAQAVTARLLEQWQRELQTGLERMRADGHLARDVDPARTAGALIAAIQGGVTLLMSTGSAEHLESVLDLCLDYLRTA